MTPARPAAVMRASVMLRAAAIVLAALLCGLGAFAFQAATRAVRARTAAPSASAASRSMASMLPQGALLTIEAPDFAALLRAWNDSPEQKAWLASGNYSVFSNSRLFGRLNDARGEFESAAAPPKKKNADDGSGLTFDADFLTQVAGRQSIFAWYDVGKLEFLYITRMSPAQAASTALMQQHSGWSTRQAGGATFYIRHPAQSESGQARTVAFSQVSQPGGALLILATREDLIANALQLIDSRTSSNSRAATVPPSVATEPWFTDASAALPSAATPPALHMVLNLDRIVPLPAFRTYWVQQNITQMKQYRAAASDLFREPAAFREERALLLKSPDTVPEQADLASLVALAPPNSGVYRATATHDSALAITALEEKLLGRVTLAALPATAAPDPSLQAAQSGSTADLETTIDTPPPVSASFSNQALAQALNQAGFDALLTWSTALAPATPRGLWIPIHSAVVLHASSAWNPEALQSALQQSLRGNLTTATLGIDFRPTATSDETIYVLTGPKPLFFAVRTNLCLLSDDQPLLLALLKQSSAPPATPAPALATSIAGFDHSSQRAPFARLTSLIDGTNQQPATPTPSANQSGNDEAAAPAYFSVNLRSLSDAFASLAGERFVERRIDTPSGPALSQTVTYEWQRP